MSDGHSEINSESSTTSIEISDGIDVKEYLAEFLEDVGADAAGTFATGNVLSNVPLPGLYIENYGLLGLPLPEKDAKALVAFAHQAPFGKGSRTIVDTSVRNTWEIDAAYIQFRNPQWDGFIGTLLDRVAHELGIIGGRNSIRADLNKLLLYEEGSFFDKHQDSEKDHGMFGTLVIALPSLHTGGDVQVTFKEQHKTLQTAPSSFAQYSYLAWYSDVEHEVKRVTSGNRLVLTYNLIHASEATNIQTAASINEASRPLCRFFQQWEQIATPTVSRIPSYMAYLLEHKYTDANLRMNHLKGRDRIMGGALIKASRTDLAVVYLANLERQVYGGAEDDYENRYRNRYGGRGYYDDEDDDDGEDDDDEYEGEEIDKHGYHIMTDLVEDSLGLRLVVRLDGSIVGKELDISEENIVQESPFDDVPDDEDYNGYLGNEGPDVTHYYRKSAFLVMPKGMEIDFVFKLGKEGKTNLKHWLLDKLREYRLQSSNSAFVYISRMCNLIIDELKTPSRSSSGLAMFSFRHGYSSRSGDSLASVLGNVLMAACELNTSELFEKAALQVKNTLDGSVYATIGRRLQDVDFQIWKNGIIQCLQHLDKLYDKYAAIVKIRECMNENCKFEQNRSSVKIWGIEILSSQMERVEDFETRDAAVFIKLAEESKEKYLFSPILDIVKKHLSNRPFVIEFANQIVESKFNGKLRAEVVRNVFHDVLFNIASDFRLDDDGPLQRTGGWGFHAQGDRSREVLANSLQGAQLGTLVNYGLQFKLFKPVTEILEKIASSTSNLAIPRLIYSVVGFLPSLSDALRSNSISLTSDHDSPIPSDLLKKLYRTALERYFREHVKTCPRKPTNWIRNQVRCSCSDCVQLNAFLRNPVEQSGRFPMGIKRRAHLHQQLDSYTNCEHVTQHFGNPHTLVVTKNNKEYIKAFAEFQDRLTTALADLGRIDFEVLKTMLGDGIRKPLRDCRWVREAMEGLLMPLRETPNNVVSNSAPRVTKAVGPSGRVVEVIDLT